MKITCPKCQNIIPPNLLNIHKKRISCHVCGRKFSIDDQLLRAKIPVNNPKTTAKAITCPECQHPIHPQQVNVIRRIGLCRVCGEVFDVAPQVPITTRQNCPTTDVIERPDNINIYNYPGKMVITIRWFAKKAVRELAAPLAMYGLFSFFAFLMLMDIPRAHSAPFSVGDWCRLILMALPYFVIFNWHIYFLFTKVFNTTEFHISP